ncbi:cobalamin-dependent protein [Deinococcus sp.]|uniref:MerR family transcriptional regulator n=1 Tax=Deinococcus sp. TaxID=47478 RepID=UPI002869A4FC|nr:B12-binding domain-containing protein [Deinococcus sp.]
MESPPNLSHNGLYTASEVESRTGVPATTLRQWERRYGFPSPARNASGYRLYSAEDVIAIGHMQAHLLRGIPASRAAELTLAGLESRPVLAGTAVGQLVADLTEALLESDHDRAATVLSVAHAQLSQEDVLLSVITPALVEIGQRWARSEITIAHEHQASAFLRARLSAMMEQAGTSGAGGPLIVAACAPGEWHELGLMMLTFALRRRGVRVTYVGADMPLADLATYAVQQGASAIALGLQGDWALPGTLEQRPALDGLNIPLFLGGALMNDAPELAGELRGIYAGPDLETATTTIIRTLSISGSAAHSMEAS